MHSLNGPPRFILDGVQYLSQVENCTAKFRLAIPRLLSPEKVRYYLDLCQSYEYYFYRAVVSVLSLLADL